VLVNCCPCGMIPQNDVPNNQLILLSLSVLIVQLQNKQSAFIQLYNLEARSSCTTCATVLRVISIRVSQSSLHYGKETERS
jgi:hypothetical protein